MQFANDLRLVLARTQTSTNRFFLKACRCGSEDLNVRRSNFTTALSVECWVHCLILAWTWTCFSSYHLVFILRILLLNIFKVAPSRSLVVGDFDAFETSAWNELLLWFVEVVFLCVWAWSNWVLCRHSRLNKRTSPRGPRPVPVYRCFGWLLDMIVQDLIGAWSDSTGIIDESTHLADFLFISFGCSCINYWCQEPRRYAWNWHLLQARIAYSRRSPALWDCLDNSYWVYNGSWALARTVVFWETMLNGGSNGIVSGWPRDVKHLLVHLNLGNVSFGCRVLLRSHIQVPVIQSEELVFWIKLCQNGRLFENSDLAVVCTRS